MESTAQPTALQLRDRVISLRWQHARGDATIEQLYAAADAYIEAIKAYKARTGKRVIIPSRAYIIRAL